MRIISGKYSGRTIKAPSSKFTRPTTDRVRESLFNILANFIDFEDALVLDIYSGSGSLGLEFLSRGASQVHFIEKNYPVYTVLADNIKSLKAENETKIIKIDAVKYTAQDLGFQYDIIIADPPFFKYDIYDVISNIFTRKLIKEDGYFIVERSIQTKDKDAEIFKIEPYRQVGDALLYLFTYDNFQPI